MIKSKTCPGCKITKPLDSYFKCSSTRRKDGRVVYCRECCYRGKKAYAARKKSEGDLHFKLIVKLNKSRSRSKIRGHKACIVDLDVLKSRYTDTCECCGKDDRVMVIDHCHETGKFRGFLCSQCNTMIGQAGESIEVLKSTIKYLKRTNK